MPSRRSDAPAGADVRRAFDAVVELPPARRRSRLDAMRLGPDVRRQVEALLAVEREADGFLESLPLAFPVRDAPARSPSGARLPRLVGPYEISGVLGRGGMGIVYEGRHGRTGQRAAVKCVELPDRALLAGIRREILTLSGLRHPGVVRILESGVADGMPWFAMELLEGRDLRDDVGLRRPRVPRRGGGAGHLPPGELARRLTLVHRLAGILAYVHGAGVVHRDLKPENVRLGSDGAPVLIDFGLTVGAAARESLESVAESAGTVAYAAPEQGMGIPLDARADIYALGCILYELVTGTAPLIGATPLETMRARAAGEPAPPSGLVGGLPPGLDELAAKLLAAERRRRLGHAGDVCRALEAMGVVPATARAPRTRPCLYRASLHGRVTAMEEVARRLDALPAASGGVLLFGGESGIGKTRLVIEAAAVAAARGFLVLTGECEAPGGSPLAAPPLQPFGRVLATVFEMCRAGGPGMAQRILGPRRRLLARYEPARGGAAREGDPGAARELSPDEEQRRIVRAVARTLRALASTAPLVLLVDDLQWCDELSLGVLERLSRGTRGVPHLLVLGAYRTDAAGRERLGKLVRGKGAALLRLAPLEGAAVGDVVGDMLAADSPPAPLVSFVVAASEGNPFFVAEYLRAALEERLLSRDGRGRWTLRRDRPGVALPLPVVLKDLVARRLASLPPAARLLAQTASVLGRESSSELLLALHGGDEAVTLAALHELMSREVLGEARPGVVRFGHDKLREVAYSGIAARRRRELHRGAADLLEERWMARSAAAAMEASPASMAEIGRHRQQSGEAAKARPLLLAAARGMLAIHGLPAAGELLRAYLALDPSRGRGRIEARVELATGVLAPAGTLREAVAQLSIALREARAASAPDLEARILVVLANVRRTLGDGARGLRDCRAALGRARASRQRSLEIDALLAQAAILDELGRRAEAREAAASALARSRRIGHTRGQARALGILAMERQETGDLAGARKLYEESLAIWREHSPSAVATILSNLGNLAVSGGDLAGGERLLGEAIARSHEAGNVGVEAAALGNLALLREESGDVLAAGELRARAVKLLREIDDPRSLAVALQNLGSSLVDLGRLDEAERAFREGAAHATAARAPLAEAFLGYGRALVAVQRGRFAPATRQLHRCLAAFSRLRSFRGVATVHVTLSEIERRRGAGAPDRAHAEAALLAAQRSGEPSVVVGALLERSRVAALRGEDGGRDLARAASLVEEKGFPAAGPLARAVADARRDAGCARPRPGDA